MSKNNTMVVTTRRFQANSIGTNDDESFGSARGLHANLGVPSPQPPPPPQLGAPLGRPAARRRQPDDDGGGGNAMTAIPEEVEVVNTNIVDANRNVATVALPQPLPVHVPAAQYLRVRIPPPSQPSLRPSRIRRRHHSRQPSSNDENKGLPSAPSSLTAMRTRQRSKTTQSSHRNEEEEEGEVVLILIPPNGSFTSERQLAECLGQVACSSFSDFCDDCYASRGGDDDSDDDDYSVDEYYEKKNFQNIAVSRFVFCVLAPIQIGF